MSVFNSLKFNFDEFELIDSHIHLSAPEFNNMYSDLFNYLKITKTLAFNVSETLDDSIITMNLSNISNNLLSFVGIHPKYSSNSNLDDFYHFFEKNYHNINGIGEIGLDKTYVNRGIKFDDQLNTFKYMLNLAEKHNLPVSIHSRDATQDVLNILSSYNISCAMLHWFSGNESQLKQINDSNILISFGPALVYSKSLQRIAKSSNLDRIIVETDGPVHFSACYEGKIAEPSLIPSIIYKLSILWNKDFDDIKNNIIKNLKEYIVVNRH